MIVLLISIVFVLVVIIIPYYKCKTIKLKNKSIKLKNKVHFYVARDMGGMLCLYIGKPFRGHTKFCPNIRNAVIVLTHRNLKSFGLNENDYVNLKWEDEPVEVFLNLED